MGSPVKTGKMCEPIALGGNVVKTFNVFSGPVSYTTGGDTLTARDLGLSFLYSVKALCITGDRIGRAIFAAAEPQQSVLFMITDGAGSEVANLSNQSTKKFIIEAEGIY